MPYPADRHIWTEDEVDELVYLRNERGLKFREIAKRMGIDSPEKVSAKYFGLGVRKRGDARRINGVAPPSVLIERDRRLEARHGLSLSAACFGDPPPGYSALDKRRRA